MIYNSIKPKKAPCFKRWARKGYSAFASMHLHVTIGVLSVGMSIIALASTEAKAQALDSVRLNQYLDSIMVYAEKASPTRSVMAQTQIFTRRESHPAVAQTLEQLLRLSPAVDVRERGGKSVQADISIRGGSFDQTQILLNGVDFTDVRTGHQTHSLPVDAQVLSSVELLDGVQGTGAYAGALNFIVTPSYSNYLRVALTGGEHGYGYGNINGAIERGGLKLFGAASYRRSDGYIYNTDFANLNTYLRGSYTTKNFGTLDLQAGFQKRDFGANGFYSLKYPNQYEETRTALGSLRWYATFGKFETNATISYRFNKDCFQLIKGDESKVPFNHHITHNIGVSGWVAYKWAAGKTTLGADYTNNAIYSTVLGEPIGSIDASGQFVPEPKRIGSIDYTKYKNRSVLNLWLRHSLQYGKFGVAASAGVSRTPYGTRGSGSAELSYYVNRGTKVYLGAVSSMRLPTFNDLYYTTTGYKGDVNLVPERAFMLRLGAQQSFERFATSAVLYWRRGSNVIDWIKRTPDADWESMQITSMNTYGAELSGAYRKKLGFLREASLSYGFIYTDKSSGEYISKYALDYMRNKLSLSATVAFCNNLLFTANGTLYDRRGSYSELDDAGNAVTKEYKPYFLLNGKLLWQHKLLEIFLEAENIASAKYFDYGGLRMPGFWASAGVVITLK